MFVFNQNCNLNRIIIIQQYFRANGAQTVSEKLASFNTMSNPPWQIGLHFVDITATWT